MKRRERATRLPTGRRHRRAIETPQDAKQGDDLGAGTKPRRSVFGRPRALTRAQIATVLAWHDSRVTLKQLAASMNVSTSTVAHAIASRGAHYKQAPPEERAESLRVHRAHRRALQVAGLL